MATPCVTLAAETGLRGIMPLTMLKSRLGHQADAEEADLDRQPSRISTSDPTTPLVQSTFSDEKSMPKRPTLHARLRRLWQHRIDLYHAEPRRRFANRLVELVPLLCLGAFMLIM